MSQFDVEDGSLQFVDTRVAALIVVYIFLPTAVVGYGTYDVSQFGIVSRYGTGIAQGAEVLARVEAVGGGMAKGAGKPPQAPPREGM